MGTGSTLTAPARVLAAMLGGTDIARHTSETRPILRGWRFETADGFLTVKATDGHRLITATVNHDGQPFENTIVPQVENLKWNDMMPAALRKTLDGDATVTVTGDEGTLSWGASGFGIATLDGYPSTESLIPPRPGAYYANLENDYVAIFNPTYLASIHDSLKRVAQFERGAADNVQARLVAVDPLKPALWEWSTVVDETLITWTYLMMPLRIY